MKKVLIALGPVLFFTDCFSSHLRGGQITISPVNCDANRYRIVLTIYTNTHSPVRVQGTLNFGDGKSVQVANLPVSIIDPDNAVGQVTFVTDHFYSTAGPYVLSYYEQNRDVSILNLDNTALVPFYIESYITVDPLLCGHTLSFTLPPTDRGCSGTAFTHNPGVVALQGDSVSYQLVTPLAESNIPVPNYQSPNSQKFYSTNFNTSNEQGNAPPTFTIDEEGTLTWDAPGMVGEYDVALKVFLWVKSGNTWANVTWVVRDMQVLVEDCGASRPYLVLPPNACVTAGETLHPIIRGYNKVFSQVIIEVTTSDNFLSSPPVFGNANVFQSTQAPYDTANIKMNWTIDCNLVRPQAYRFIFKISSYTNSGIRVSSYQIWNVTVNGPPPKYQSLALDLTNRKLDIAWKGYACPNARTMQVWRRVDQGPSSSDPCKSGIPKSWGFTKIGETTNNHFVDGNLNPGATYCYRLLAVYASPYQTVSISSKDTCIGPIVADAPVVTNVSISSTDKANGIILTKWTSPFQINKSLFPSPYQYDVFRTVDGTSFKLIKSKTSDTTFIDDHLDVTDTLYGYKVVVYSPQSIAHDNPIDTSALAFYPRLSFEPLVDSIKLSWDAQVPWSNRSLKFPWHFIYRKELGASNYVLVDSVNVMVDGDFVYKDYLGKNTFPIKSNTVYLYKIETQGVYGNPHIREPLQNYSNEILGQAIDKTPPCAPALEISTADCETVLNSPCNSASYTNQLSWKYSSDCGNDVAYYQVVFSEGQDSDSTLLASTAELFYPDPKKISRSGCYRVYAVDRSGNQGSPSEIKCIENCGYVYVPNVISVNNDGLNETFPDVSNVGDTREPSKCPRFVKDFSLQIFDRWGEQVYSVQNLDTTHPNFEWKGLDKNGKELPTGLYYYSANFYFYGAKPETQSQNVKGWVNLVR